MAALFLRALRRAVFPTRCVACRAFFHPPAGRLPLDFGRRRDQRWTAGRGPADPGGGEPSAADPLAILRLPIRTVFEQVLAQVLCPSCAESFRPVESPLCPACGVMFAGRHGADHLCGACLIQPRRFGRARALGCYENVLMALVHGFKYRGKTQLARPLGRLLFLTFIRNWDPATVDLIVPVPLHQRRIRERGFNQTALMLRDWGKYLLEMGLDPAAVRRGWSLLSRHRSTDPQIGLGRRARQRNVQKAFAVTAAVDLAEKRILLVDDVYTTGATVNECAGALLAEGAQRVDVLTLARAL
jgi:ComF family protein